MQESHDMQGSLLHYQLWCYLAVEQFLDWLWVLLAFFPLSFWISRIALHFPLHSKLSYCIEVEYRQQLFYLRKECSLTLFQSCLQSTHHQSSQQHQWASPYWDVAFPLYFLSFRVSHAMQICVVAVAAVSAHEIVVWFVGTVCVQ